MVKIDHNNQPHLISLPKICPKFRCKLRMLKLERTKDWLLMEEEFLNNIKSNKSISRDEFRLKLANKMRGSTMAVATLLEFVGDNHAIITLGKGESEWIVPILSIADRSKLKVNCNVLISLRNFSVVGVIDDIDSKVLAMKLTKAPPETFDDIGGMDEQIQEIKEAVELPLTHPEYFESLGIKAPKGVILFGPPGTGKTLLAKAVANSTSASFLYVVASELVQKHIGEGAKLVRELFKLAAENSPTIIFIDEIDAIGVKRGNEETGGEREVQRTLLELLNQLDGFDEKSGVRVILATNSIDRLDQALIRPGRIDRKIEVPLPNNEGRRKIFEIHSQSMMKAEKIDVDSILEGVEFSGADIKSICIEAGYRALRDRRREVTNDDFLKAKEQVAASRKANPDKEGKYIA
ncbi:26S proteasome regulatory subunit 4-like [Tetranychus urticae]|uniref:26S proteasome regulatory subunit 4-like n=1 Tax=Tetranychus urticae TaxID=32264 RepID=UPI00077BD4FC|nr:26S proteasome regulatory subunit 4-like [Tetranychus urticae]